MHYKKAIELNDGDVCVEPVRGTVRSVVVVDRGVQINWYGPEPPTVRPENEYLAVQEPKA